jgi:hypothetical protein
MSILVDMGNYNWDEGDKDNVRGIPMIDPEDDSPTEDEDRDSDAEVAFSDDDTLVDPKGKGKKPVRPSRAKAAVLLAPPQTKGRRKQLHQHALDVIINDNNIDKTVANRTIKGSQGKLAQTKLIQDVVGTLGLMCNFKGRHLLRSRNPDGVIKPLRRITPSTYEHEMKRREKFSKILGPIHVVRGWFTFNKPFANVFQGVQSRLSQRTRKVSSEEQQELEHEVKLMGLLAGDTPTVPHFDMWVIGHVHHGWTAKLEDDYIKEHGSAPTGNDAAAIRASYCKKYVKTRLDPVVAKALYAKYAQYKLDVTCVYTEMKSIGTVPTPGDNLSAEDRHMCVYLSLSLSLNV